MRIIPKGKQVVFYKIDKGYPYALNPLFPALLEDTQFQVTVGSKFDFLAENKANVLLTLGSKELEKLTAKGLSFTGQFSKLSYKVWQSTDALSFNLNVGFYQTYNAKIEVMEPIQNIVNQVLPTENGAFGSLKSPGVAVSDVLNDNYTGAIAIRIGNLFFTPMLIEKAEPTYSTEMDTSGGFMWGKLSLDITGLKTATQESFNKTSFF